INPARQNPVRKTDFSLSGLESDQGRAPEHKMFISCQTRLGWLMRRALGGRPAGQPPCDDAFGVRFVSELQGLPRPPAGMPELRRQHKSAASLASEFHPGSRPRKADLPRISVKPAAAAAPHNCGPHTFFRVSTAVLPVKPRFEPAGESACHSTVPPVSR